jgi:hypothetical protein
MVRQGVATWPLSTGHSPPAGPPSPVAAEAGMMRAYRNSREQPLPSDAPATDTEVLRAKLKQESPAGDADTNPGPVPGSH